MTAVYLLGPVLSVIGAGMEIASVADGHKLSTSDTLVWLSLVIFWSLYGGIYRVIAARKNLP